MMMLPLLWRNLIQPSNHAIVEAISALLKDYADILYQKLPDLKKAFNWDEPKESVASLISINIMICMLPKLLSDYGVSTLIQSLAYISMASFIIKEVASSSVTLGACPIDEDNAEVVLTHVQHAIDKLQEVLLWKDVNLSSWSFVACIIIMGSIHLLGSLPVVLMLTNALSLSYHPQLAALVRTKRD
jgi:hypothetical protein